MAKLTTMIFFSSELQNLEFVGAGAGACLGWSGIGGPQREMDGDAHGRHGWRID